MAKTKNYAIVEVDYDWQLQCILFLIILLAAAIFYNHHEQKIALEQLATRIEIAALETEAFKLSYLTEFLKMKAQECGVAMEELQGLMENQLKHSEDVVAAARQTAKSIAEHSEKLDAFSRLKQHASDFYEAAKVSGEHRKSYRINQNLH